MKNLWGKFLSMFNRTQTDERHRKHDRADELVAAAQEASEHVAHARTTIVRVGGRVDSMRLSFQRANRRLNL